MEGDRIKVLIVDDLEVIRVLSFLKATGQARRDIPAERDWTRARLISRVPAR